MKTINEILEKILSAKPIELARFLQDLNRQVYSENEWNSIAVKSSYASLSNAIRLKHQDVRMMCECGTLTTDVEDYSSGRHYTYDNTQALHNLEAACDFFKNPPVVEASEVKCAIDMAEGTPTICKNARDDDKKPDTISSIDGLSKYLGCGKTTSMKIMKQKREKLVNDGVAYQVGRKWFFNRERLDEKLRQDVNYLK